MAAAMPHKSVRGAPRARALATAGARAAAGRVPPRQPSARQHLRLSAQAASRLGRRHPCRLARRRHPFSTAMARHTTLILNFIQSKTDRALASKPQRSWPRPATRAAGRVPGALGLTWKELCTREHFLQNICQFIRLPIHEKDYWRMANGQPGPAMVANQSGAALHPGRPSRGLPDGRGPPAGGPRPASRDPSTVAGSATRCATAARRSPKARPVRDSAQDRRHPPSA
eukprot:363197-Chlamydomonas_euryale.AAC.7